MHIVAAHSLKKFKVHLLFENGVSGIVDLSDLAGHGVFEAWMHPGFFEQIMVTKSGALSWPGDLDLCPDSLYLRLIGKESKKNSAPVDCNLAYA